MADPTTLPFTEKLALLGLAQPASRAFVAATLAGTFSYVTKMPACFYEEDGSITTVLVNLIRSKNSVCQTD